MLRSRITPFQLEYVHLSNAFRQTVLFVHKSLDMNLLDDMFTNVREDDKKVIKLLENLSVFFDLLIAVDGKLPKIFKAIIFHLKYIAGKLFHSRVPRRVLLPWMTY